MTWTKVTKPTTNAWTNTNPDGRTQYDQANVTYDSSSMFYDGVNNSAWTNLSKPISSVWTKVVKPT